MKKPLLPLVILALFLSFFVQAQVITTVAGDGTAGYNGEGIAAVYAKLHIPCFVLPDGSGNIYIADGDNSRIRKVDAAGVISSIAGTGTFGFSGDGGPATAAQLGFPSSLAFDGSGNLIFTDEINERIRIISPAGIINTIAGDGTTGFGGDSSTATAAQLHTPMSVCVDGSGNIYFVDLGNNRIRKISTSGIITTVVGTGAYGFSGDGGAATAANINRPNNVIVDAANNLYLAELYNNRVRKVTSSGIISTIAGNGTAGFSGDGGQATNAQIHSPMSVALDAGGNLYIADADNERIRKVNSSGIISTIVGTGATGYSGDGGPASAATLYIPFSVTLDAAGNLYVVDQDNHSIRKVTSCAVPYVPAITGAPSVATYATTLFSNGVSGGTWFSNSHSVATVSSVGMVYGVSSGSAIISYSIPNSCGTTIVTMPLTVTPTPSICNNIYTIAGTGISGYSGDGGAATAAQVNSPAGVIFDAAGNLYVADQAGCTIRKISPTGIVTTFAGTGTYGHSGDGGAATAAQLGEPTTMCFDLSGNMYVAEPASSYIRKISTSGIISSVAGNFTYGYSGDGGPASASALDQPLSVVADAAGNIYIADALNSCVRKIDTSGIITTIAGGGGAASGYGGDGGPATAATLNVTTSVALDTANNLYIADGANGRIRKVSPSGIITTIAGTGTRGYSGDGGPATAAMLDFPISVVVDSAGEVFVSDINSSVIRKISTSGIITTVAGNGYIGYSGDSCAAAAARLYYPQGVTLDGRNNIYIADLFNARVRKVITDMPNTGAITGDTSMYAGDTTVYAENVPGGSWSTSNASIATIDPATGVLAALAAGSVTITYTVTGTCGTAYTTHILAVYSINRISGTINFNSTPIDTTGVLKVWLVTYNTSTTLLQAIDSVLPSLHGGTTAYYEFLGAAADSYRVVAAYSPPVFDSIGYIPTYYTTSLYWDSAHVFLHTATVANDYLGINMNFGIATAGAGFIGGYIASGGSKGTATTIPAVGMLVILRNSTTGLVIQQTYTNLLGHFSFSNLPTGQTYLVYPEALNYATTPYSGINLSSSSTAMSSANFIQHTASKTITPANVAVTNPSEIPLSITVFPNPACDKINVSFQGITEARVTVTIYGIAGNVVYFSECPLTKGTDTMPINVSSLDAGMYLISVKAGTKNYVNKIRLKK